MVKREEPKKFYDMTDPNFRDFKYSVVLVLEPDFCQTPEPDFPLVAEPDVRQLFGTDFRDNFEPDCCQIVEQEFLVVLRTQICRFT